MAEPPKPKVTWAEAIMRIGLRMIDKGQGLAFFLGICLLIVFLKLDSSELLGLLRNLIVLPWVILPLTIAGWFFHVRFVDRITRAENRRVGKENGHLRERILDLEQQLRNGDES